MNGRSSSHTPYSSIKKMKLLTAGSGKSLCYQLPAYMLSLQQPTLVIVICPLISLMHDQVQRLPKGYGLTLACFVLPLCFFSAIGVRRLREACSHERRQES